MRTHWRRLGLALAVLIAACPALPAAAQSNSAAPGAPAIELQVSSGQLITLPHAAASVFVADPAIADVQAPSRTSIFVFGKQPGRTSLFALDEHGHPLLSRTVVVAQNVGEIEHAIREQVPGATVNVQGTPHGLILSGNVATPEDAATVTALASRFVGEKGAVINRVRVPAANEVNLRVRVAEVSRQITKEFGFDWNAVVNPGSFSFGVATGRSFLSNAGGSLLSSPGGTFLPSATGAGSLLGAYRASRANVNTLLDLLAEQGLITILAEPNLTAISGQPASFLAGGEFPIPIGQGNGAVSIEFKKYGVMLEFVPTVLSSDRISIKVKPEVSELTTQGSITLQGITIPGLSVRRAETTVELGSGQSFAIAGLIQNNTSTDLTRYPGLADLPVLGPLFRSSRFQRNESELVIIVTPYIVHPAPNAAALKLPTDGFAPASDLERIFAGRAVAAGVQPAGTVGLGPSRARLTGDAGFVVE